MPSNTEIDSTVGTSNSMPELNSHLTATSSPSKSFKQDDDILVRVENVGKIFCRDLKKSLFYGVRDGLGDLLPSCGRKYDSEGNPILRKSEFWANEEISFELRRGECLGLMGHNGAGKTTLLKMLNGLIKPDTGRIEMRGRVGALIALGAGFNPILTGRENVYVAGSVLGLTKKEIDEKYDEIVEFSELKEFINTPVQNYSSGMQVRLGFAVASSLDPDILLLDEVLAVGDMTFVIKCMNRVRNIMRRSAVILVSHRPQQVSNFCSKIMLLEKGQKTFMSMDVAEGLDLYVKDSPNRLMVSGTGAATMDNLKLTVDGAEDHGNLVEVNGKPAPFHLDFDIEIKDPKSPVVVHILVKDQAMNAIVNYDLREPGGEFIEFKAGNYRLNCSLSNLGLTAGKYSFLIAIVERASGTILGRYEGVAPFIITGAQTRYAPISSEAEVSVTAL